MAKSVADVMKMLNENEVKFVDFRFTDTRGKEQHVTVPVSHFDEDKFSDGHAFDGSSIAGWKGIEASDMLLMPDPATANIDPFFDESTLILTCDVLEPGDGKAYDRDPRSIARRAEAYLKASGIGDTAYFGPEPEFFVFDGVRWSTEPGHSFYRIEEYEAPWNSGAKLEGGNRGHRPTTKGGYFPVPPVDSTHDMRAEMSLILESLGVPGERVHHEVFHVPTAEDVADPVAVAAAVADAVVTVTLDGRTSRVEMADATESILAATLRVRPDAPYSCTGGMCGTCRARVISGEVRMDRSYALEPDEIAAGMVLACQSHPVTDEVELTYDE